jgi:7-carboxy-7-deazaguanine synthase
MKNTKTIKINEIFYSLQGEGTDIGFPTIFIRLTGCNLRCTYCDTKYAYYDGKEMSISKILTALSKWNCNRICITGGEPLLQKNIFSLISQLRKKNYEISIETNGSLNITKLTQLAVAIKMDVKLPTSGENHKMQLQNVSKLRITDELKFIIGNKTDFISAKTIIETHKPTCNIIMQPIWGKVKNLANWILKHQLNVRYSPQLHKILWGETKGK